MQEVLNMNTNAIKGVLGIFVVLLVGTMALFVGAVVEQNNQPAPIVPVVTTAAAAQPTYVGEPRAIEIAKSVASGKVVEVELQNKNGIVMYAVEIDGGGTETEVKIDALTGKVLGTETEVEPSTVGPHPISEEEAIAIARQVVKSGTLTEVELEAENGVLVYAVEFADNGRETEVMVSMDTGAIVAIEHEEGDDD